VPRLEEAVSRVLALCACAVRLAQNSRSCFVGREIRREIGPVEHFMSCIVGVAISLLAHIKPKIN
jgi:hypothetical protein